MIEFQNVSFAWQGKPDLLQNFSWKIDLGARFCLQGDSGLGKTCLLLLAAGLLKPQKGKIKRQITTTAFAFQEQRLLPWLNCLDNIRFVLSRKLNASETMEQAKYWLQAVGLADAQEQKPTELSGGMGQRLNLARALAVQPDMLFLDEPFAALDKNSIDNCAALLREWQADASENPRTLLMVSHQAAQAELCQAKLLKLQGPPLSFKNRH